MADSPTNSRISVDQALESLRIAVADAIRAEQLCDRLTGLANDDALTEWIETHIENGVQFWIAFVEVDRFKNINDKYGYDDADQLLKKIAGQLERASKDFFPGGAVPIRAHGDEFFVVGDVEIGADPKPEESIGDALDQIRRNVAAIRLPHRGKEPMKCTVSVGWLLSTDLLNATDGLTPRNIRGSLELAVAQAKLTRDAVVRFSHEMRTSKGTTVEGRSDCTECRAKFTVTVQEKRLQAGTLFCPNCGKSASRPPSLEPPAVPPTAVEI